MSRRDDLSNIPCRLVNAFAFWQGQDIGNATATYLDDLMQAYAHIEDTAGPDADIEIWNGETGWPGTGQRCTPAFQKDLR